MAIKLLDLWFEVHLSLNKNKVPVPAHREPHDEVRSTNDGCVLVFRHKSFQVIRDVGAYCTADERSPEEAVRVQKICEDPTEVVFILITARR